MEFPQEEKAVDSKIAPPNTSFVVRLPMDAKSTASISLKPNASLRMVVVLIVIFTFVSIMVGLLVWIFQYEMKKRGENPRFRPQASVTFEMI